MGGPQFTEMVLKLEVDHIVSILESSTPGYKPKILYCLVDRNRPHRLFGVNQQKDMINPQSGTCVDYALVEK